MNLDILIQRISYFRNKANLSARELSLRIDKSDTYINQVECGNFTISVPVLFDIIAALEISCEEFFADNYVTYHKDKELNSLFNDLTVENKEMIISLIKKLK